MQFVIPQYDVTFTSASAGDSDFTFIVSRDSLNAFIDILISNGVKVIKITEHSLAVSSS